MTTPSFSDIYKFADAVQKVSQAARREFLEIAGIIDFADAEVATEQLRSAVLTIVQKYGLAASEIGAQWYEYCRAGEFSRGYTAIVGEVSRYSALSDADAIIGKYVSQELTEGEFVQRLAGVVTNQTMRQSRDSILENLDEDLRAARAENDTEFADRAGWARVPQGETCAFCLLLASQGFVYNTRKSALSGHPGCNCTAVPFHDAHKIPGYGTKLESYERIYREADNLRRSGDLPDELNDRIKEARLAHREAYEKGDTTHRWNSANELAIIMRYQHPELH